MIFPVKMAYPPASVQQASSTVIISKPLSGNITKYTAASTTQTRSDAPVQYASDHPIAKEDTIL